MKIEVVYKDCEEELQNFIFEYGETTTLADLLNELGLNPLVFIWIKKIIYVIIREEKMFI